jgi:hypothetical protein
LHGYAVRHPAAHGGQDAFFGSQGSCGGHDGAPAPILCGCASALALTGLVPADEKRKPGSGGRQQFG